MPAKIDPDTVEENGIQWIQEMMVADDQPLTPLTPSAVDQQIMPLVDRAYRLYQTHRPLLALSRSKREGEWGVIAQEPIEAGTVVIEYLGEWKPKAEEPSTYRFGCIDAKRYRNYAAMVDDGFPNLGAFYLYDADGLPLRILFVAYEDIEPGQPLAINYGSTHSVKFGCHQESRLKALEDYCNSCSFTERVKMLQKRNSFHRAFFSWKENVLLEAELSQLQYLFQTPRALIYCLENELLLPLEALSFYEKIDHRLYLLGQPFSLTIPQKRLHLYVEAILQFYASGARLPTHYVDSLEAISMEALEKQVFLRGAETSAASSRLHGPAELLQLI